MPRRLLVLFSPNGSLVEEFFRPSRDGSIAFGKILEPLRPFRDQLLLLDGVSMGVTDLGPGNEHQRGMAAWLTGQPNQHGEFCGGNACSSGTSGWATGPSIDQRIAQLHAGATALPSLELAVRLEGSNNRHRMSFNGAERPVAPDHDPRSVYRRLFRSSDRDLEGEGCLVDQVAEQYRSLSRQLNARDRERLDAHLAAVEGIERRLHELAEARGCGSAPSEPPQLELRDPTNYPEITGLQCDLLVAALRCDLTRVGSLMWSGATAKVLPSWLNGQTYADVPFTAPMTSSFHSYTHDAHRDQNDPAQREVRNKLIATYRWYASGVAGMLARLQEVREADGSTLLDNTLVLWGSELASPDVHSFERMPFLIAGGSKFLRTGRYLDLGGEQHTAVLATIGRLFGLSDERFGHPDYARGPLLELIR